MHLSNTFVFLGERRAELSDNSGAALNQRFFVPWISLQILMPILVILMHSFTNSNCFTELIERFIIVFTLAGSVVQLTSHRMLFSIFSWWPDFAISYIHFNIPIVFLRYKRSKSFISKSFCKTAWCYVFHSNVDKIWSSFSYNK